MSMRIERQDTVKRKIDEYSQNTEHTEEEYEKLFLDCSSILKAKWDGFCNNSNLSEKYKRVIGYAYTSYVKKLKKLGFINSENITYILEILDKNITSFCSKPIEGVNVNIKMYKILKIRMYKIVHFYFQLFSPVSIILSFNLYDFPFILII